MTLSQEQASNECGSECEYSPASVNTSSPTEQDLESEREFGEQSQRADDQELDEQHAQDQQASDRESLRRALRDLEAAEERVKRNAERVYEEARGSLVHELFPVLDNLDRSIEAAKAGSDPTLLEGVQMVRRALDDVLVRYGAERVDANGGSFDPNLHEAVGTVHVDDPAQDMTVREQLAPGYRFGQRLLRPAKVVVGVTR